MANFTGSSRADTILATDSSDTVMANGGNDVIIGKAGDDRLFGGDGDDFVIADNSYQTYPDGYGVHDYFTGIDVDRDQVYGGAGRDTINGSAGSDILKGDAGDDRLAGFNGRDTLSGGDGNDLLAGDSAVSVPLVTPDNDDTLWGELGNDELRGGRGADFLAGGPGRDTLVGDEEGWEEAGGDIFRIDAAQVNTGADFVVDFGAGDQILINGGRANGGVVKTYAAAGDVIVQVDLDGGGRTHKLTTLATLDNVRLDEFDLVNSGGNVLLNYG